MDKRSWDHLGDLRDSMIAESTQDTRVVQDAAGRIYATGKRKCSIARVWIKPGGQGRFTVNGRQKENYFARDLLQITVLNPFYQTNRMGQYDVMCTVKGGGLSGQAGAIRHGISKALQLSEPGLRTLLKEAGFLTRDSRCVERKKPGLKKARKASQFSKR